MFWTTQSIIATPNKPVCCYWENASTSLYKNNKFYITLKKNINNQTHPYTAIEKIEAPPIIKIV